MTRSIRGSFMAPICERVIDSNAAPNNGTHPTPRHEVSHVCCMWALVIGGIRLLRDSWRDECLERK